ncbi:MAG: NFACT RNA binding domain-containing protein [Spirochaetales bacterium]
MSLNWKEINRILDELELEGSHIQQILQPDFKHLVLELYGRSGRKSLLVSMEQGATRLHETRSRFRKSSKSQRFEALLRSRIRGGIIDSIEHVENDRILRIDIRRSDEHPVLWIRLWGSAPNVLLTESDGTIIDCFFRRPKRGESSGNHFDPERAVARGNRGDPERFSVRPFDGFSSLNEAVDHEYGEARRQRELERLRRDAAKALRDAEQRISAKVTGLHNKRQSGTQADSDRKCGDLILANLYRITPGSELLVAEDWEQEGSTIEIPLDRALTPQENAQRYYDRARKREREQKNIDQQIVDAEEELSQVRATISQLDTFEDPSSLRQITDRYGKPRGGGRKQGSDRASGAPGITLQLQGFTVLVGRNARENDVLLRRHARGNDWWVHTRDYAGGYVFVRAIAGKTVPLEVLLDAAQLAIRYSKAPQASSGVDLYYTQVKHLRRAKDGPRGLVLPTQEKNLTVVPDEARVRALLSSPLDTDRR